MDYSIYYQSDLEFAMKTFGYIYYHSGKNLKRKKVEKKYGFILKYNLVKELIKCPHK